MRRRLRRWLNNRFIDILPGGFSAGTGALSITVRVRVQKWNPLFWAWVLTPPEWAR